MARNIEDGEVERLAARTAALIGERKASLTRFLEQEVWPTVPKGILGKDISRDEEGAILGYRD